MLSGYKILDLTGELGPLGAKMLSDFGADVIKIEPPTGSPERSAKPFYHDEPGVENSLVFWAYNTGKKGVTLNLESEQGKDIFRRLVKEADAVMESYAPGYMASLGLGYEDLKKINPKIVFTSITPYGQTGPYVDWKYTDLTIWAMGGTMASAGYPDRPPVRISTHQVNSFGGQYGALATLTALYGLRHGGEGTYIDVSAYEAVGRLVLMEPAAWLFHHRHMHRSGPRNQRGPVLLRQVWECKDGNVATRLSPGKQARTLKTLMEWIMEVGEGDGLEKYNFDDLPHLPGMQPQIDEIEGIMERFFLKRTKAELFAESKKRKFDLVAVQDAADIVADEQLAFRDFWSEIEHEDLGETYKYPGTYFVSTGGRWAPTKRAPHLGEHNAEIYGALGFDADQLKALKEGGVI